MMRVHPAPEPDAFDENVRQPGRRALDRLAAEKYSGSKEAIPVSEFPPYWRRSLDDLLAAYHRICSYLCLYIPRGTGARSVDHMVPKSTAWDQAYEWHNFRLACSLMNSRKGAAPLFSIHSKSRTGGSYWSWLRFRCCLPMAWLTRRPMPSRTPSSGCA